MNSPTLTAQRARPGGSASLPHRSRRSSHRAAFGRTVEEHRSQERIEQGFPPNTDLGHVAQAQIDRVAIGCALVEHGQLSFTQRSITPQIKS